jgi:aminoglycoside phosphotransferase family enzyme
VSAADLAEKVAFLSQPAAYSDGARSVERIETHMSWVFLTERHAYKLKKPVRYDSLDFSSLELRRQDCEDEVQLNRRLARDVYLGTLALTQAPDGKLQLGAGGETLDWLVHMRRLPADRMLDELIRTDRIRQADVRLAAQRLAEFYAQAPTALLAPPAYRKRLEEGVHSDCQELCRPELGLARDRVARLARDQLAFLERHRGLLDRRVEEGRIVEGHGDLRPEHICLTDDPAIIDCLEFSLVLRTVDPADELAFLALECERLGKPEVGRWFLESYTRVTGDEPPPLLMDFHRTYRAMRRATIAVWHLQDPDVMDRDKWRERARCYLELARPVAG